MEGTPSLHGDDRGGAECLKSCPRTLSCWIRSSADGRWLSVLHCGSLAFQKDDVSRTVFIMEPECCCPSNRYLISTTTDEAHGSGIPGNGGPSYLHVPSSAEGIDGPSAVVLAGADRDSATPAVVNFDSHGRVTVAFAGRRMVRSGGRSGRVSLEFPAVPRRRRRWLFEAVELLPHPGGGRRGALKLPVPLHLRGPRGSFLCSGGPVIKETTQVPCCCDVFLLDLPTAASGSGSQTVQGRLWTSDGLRLVAREADGAVAASPQTSCCGRELFNLGINPGGGGGGGLLSITWQQPPPPAPGPFAAGAAGPALPAQLGSAPLRTSGSRSGNLADPRSPTTAAVFCGPSPRSARATPGSLSGGLEGPSSSISRQQLIPSTSSSAGGLMGGRGSSFSSAASMSGLASLCQLGDAASPAQTRAEAPVEGLSGPNATWKLKPQLAPGRHLLVMTHHGHLLIRGAVNPESSPSNSPCRRHSQPAGHPPTNSFDTEAAFGLPASEASSEGPRGMALAAAWTLQHHGDAVFSIHCASDSASLGSSRFLFVDGLGHIGVTRSPGSAFPSFACLFELQICSCTHRHRQQQQQRQQPEGNDADESLRRRDSSSSVGFNLRTMMPVKGARRFVHAEPSGRLVAADAHRPGPWGVFSLADIEALAGCPLAHPWRAVALPPSSPAPDKPTRAGVPLPADAEVAAALCTTASAAAKELRVVHGSRSHQEELIFQYAESIPLGGGLGRAVPEVDRALQAWTARHNGSSSSIAPSGLPRHTESVRGWGLRNPPTLREASMAAVVSALKAEVQACKSSGPCTMARRPAEEHVMRRIRQLGLPESIQEEMLQRCAPSDKEEGHRCSVVLPREFGAVPDPAAQATNPRRIADSMFECRSCGCCRLAMDPRFNSLHHRHFELLMRQGPQRQFHQGGAGRRPMGGHDMILLATISIFLGTVLGAAVAPPAPVWDGNAQGRGRLQCLFRRSPPRQVNQVPGAGRAARDGQQGNEAAAAPLPLRLYGKMQSWLSMLPRDPWMWTHLVIVNVFGRLSGG